MRICGLEFTSDAIDRVRQTLDEKPWTSRRSVARNLCQWMHWKAASGRAKEAACRKALMALDERGVIDLELESIRLTTGQDFHTNLTISD